jgi:hypothetical protein
VIVMITVETLKNPETPTKPAKPGIAGAWIALATTPFLLVALDVAAEWSMMSGYLSSFAANGIAFMVMFIPLGVAIVLAARSLRAGVRRARWPLGIAIVLTAVLTVLLVVALLP